jgi:hypothetical protein
MNQIKACVQFKSGLARHQVYVGSKVFEVFADGKKEAKSIVEGRGYKVSFVTRFI